MHLYSVPLIQQDLRHEEAIIQAVNAFEYLENVISDVFATINARIDKNNSRVDDIRHRINVANAKVEKLVGIKKSVTIYSPAKYPSGETVEDIPVTFPTSHPDDTVKLNQDYTVESQLDPVSHKRLQDKLHFYHVRKINEQSSSVIPEGLGAPPAHLTSINSFLLFNTAENPYEHYNKVDPLSGTIRTTSSSTVLEDDSQKMEAAPLSISNRNAQPKKVSDNFFYTPQHDDAPALDVPDDLPDLPGIAGDVTFSEEPHQAFPETTPGTISTLLPTDDELDLNISVIKPVEIHEEVPKIAEISSPPPPPPPQPMMTSSPATSTAKPSAEKSLPQMSDARSNLMEAIRQAGGKTQRAAEQKPPGKKEAPPPAGGGDLMADLRNKLTSRRKGISGAKDATGVMDKISALIPPPPKPTPTMDASEDDDWE